VSSAIIEASLALEHFPEESLAYEMLLKAYAAQGDEEKMLDVWNNHFEKFQKGTLRRDLLEEICLGILKKGCESDSLTTRLIGFLAIAKTELPEAVLLIKKGMNDSNAQLRSLNVELASLYSGEPLQEEIVRLFFHEKNNEVRRALLKAIGKLKIQRLLPDLVERDCRSSRKVHKRGA
jgi:HEAT repeat protein